MSDLVGNAEDRFSRVAAHIIRGAFVIIRAATPENFSLGFPTRSDTKRSVLTLKRARSLRF